MLLQTCMLMLVIGCPDSPKVPSIVVGFAFTSVGKVIGILHSEEFSAFPVLDDLIREARLIFSFVKILDKQLDDGALIFRKIDLALGRFLHEISVVQPRFRALDSFEFSPCRQS